MPSIELLKELQAQPLELKVAHTKQRIREWVREYGTDGVYVSFSGGKDSTVLLHIVRSMYPNIPAVFVDTGLEYPEIRQFVKTFDNVEILRPKMSFVDVIKKYGYPIISKNVSHNVSIARRNPNGNIYKNCFDKNKKGRYAIHKYEPLIGVDFLISDRCCNVMKKTPLKDYEKNTKKKPIIATMTCESKMREDSWLHNGCNAFNIRNPHSTPMSFWTEQDVLQFVFENNIEIAMPYGEVVNDEENGQMVICGCENSYTTTGCKRTGCIFCGFGCHLEKESRWIRLKETHPRQYEYCIGGGEYNENGIWQPNKEGLGLGHCFDVLNEIYGKDFIVYK